MGNILQILMMLPQLITGVEKIIPQSGQGPAKLEIVKSVVAAAVPPTQQPQVMPQIEQFISLIVMFMNIAQAFKTASVPPGMPTGPAPTPQPATGTITGTVYAEHDVFDPKLPSAASPVPLPQQVAEVAQAPRPF